jgi:N-acetylmuramoyl-L-alanine amidase
VERLRSVLAICANELLTTSSYGPIMMRPLLRSCRPMVGDMDRRNLLRLTFAASLAGIGGFPVPPAGAAEPADVPRRKPKAVRRPRRLIIDPGHGGHDPGAIGARGTYEKNITLDIALQIAARLNGMRGIAVRTTRDEDVFLPLADRVAAARATEADLFVSIHADSAPNREARGLSAYILADKASDDFAGALAKRENLADLAGGIDLKDTRREIVAILSDLAVRHTRNASLQVRASVVDGAGRSLRLLDNPMRAANFAVLKAPDIPSILIETGFLSNDRDEELLRDPSQRRRIADVLARELSTVLTSSLFA